jgi:hypothetical protein
MSDNLHYNFEKYKAFRLGRLERDKAKFIELRTKDGLESTQQDIDALEVRFMENEIKDVDRVLRGELGISEKLLRSRSGGKEPLALSESDRVEIIKWKQFAVRHIEQLSAPHTEYSNREKFMAHECRVKAGIEPRKTATELRKQSNGLYKASLTLNERKNNTKYRPLTETEIIHIIELLEGTAAQKFAIELQSKS